MPSVKRERQIYDVPGLGFLKWDKARDTFVLHTGKLQASAETAFDQAVIPTAVELTPKFQAPGYENESVLFAVPFGADFNKETEMLDITLQIMGPRGEAVPFVVGSMKPSDMIQSLENLKAAVESFYT